MDPCCEKTFRKILEQVLSSLKHNDVKNVSDVIKILEFAVAMLKNQELINKVTVTDEKN